MKKCKICLLLLAVLGAIGSFSFIFNSSEHRLSEEEILGLRTQYPICGLEIPPMVDIIPSTLEEYIENVTKHQKMSFVYGEVVGELYTYGKNLSTGYSQLDEKHGENGINPYHEFYEYTILVIEDTEGRYKKGEQITISANISFIDYNPRLSDGMKIVVPILEAEPDINREWYNVTGMYYVTEQGYVISAYDEEKLLERTSMNGITIESLLKQLKKMIK